MCALGARHIDLIPLWNYSLYCIILVHLTFHHNNITGVYKVEVIGTDEGWLFFNLYGINYYIINSSFH